MTNENERVRMPLLGEKCPEFEAATTQGNIKFPQDFRGKWVVFFSHPSDFTPVCTTEFMTFAHRAKELTALNTALVGLSVDSITSHIAWLRRIEEIEWKDMKDVYVEFPLIDDISMNISRKFGMIMPSMSSTQSVRAVFIIDPEGIIRLILYYPMSCGRNFDEIKRVLMALQKADKDKCATPMDWKPGDDTIVSVPKTMGLAKERAELKSGEKYSLDWFLCFNKES
jgi:peroxiredoxin (alkyl hydroperoxide reductase subunit C)